MRILTEQFTSVRKCVAFWIGLAAVVLLGWSMLLYPPGAERPLVAKDQWIISDGFFADRLPITPIEAPAFLRHSPETMTWRSWSPATNGSTGTLESAVFSLPEYIAVPYTGFPDEVPSQILALKCASTGIERPLATARTNNQWATVFLAVRGLCPDGRASLIARVASRQFYIGVATPFSVSRFTYWVHTSYLARAAVVLAMAVMLCILATPGILIARGASGQVEVASGLASVGIFSMLTLAGLTASPIIGMLVASSCLLGSTAIAIAALQRGWLRRKLSADLIPAIGMWVGLALAYVGLVTTVDNGGGSWAVNGLFSPLRWSADNQLPMLMTEALLSDVPRASITFSVWQATDRGPFLAALLAFPGMVLTLLSSGGYSAFASIAYEVCAIVAQTSWVLLLPSALRQFGANRIVYGSLLLASSPFLLFNSVYVWPKLLGAAYVVASFCVLASIRNDAGSPSLRLVLASICSILGYLSHGSQALVIAPMIATFAVVILKNDLRALALAALAVAMVYLPWAYWQIFIQPNGNALIRYSLTGTFGFDKRNVSVLADMLETYGRLGVSGVVEHRLNALLWLTGLGPKWHLLAEVKRSDSEVFTGAARVYDFFFLSRSIGIFLLGAASLLIAWMRSRLQQIENSTSIATVACFVGLSSFGFTWLISMGQSFTHHYAYGAILLLLFASAVGIQRFPRYLALGIIAITVTYTISIWILPVLASALRLRVDGLIGAVIGIVGFIVFAARSSKTPCGRRGNIEVSN